MKSMVEVGTVVNACRHQSLVNIARYCFAVSFRYNTSQSPVYHGMSTKVNIYNMMIKQLVTRYFRISIIYNVQYIRQPLHKQFIVRWTKQFSHTSLFSIYVGICPRSAIRSSRKDALEHNGCGVTQSYKEFI